MQVPEQVVVERDAAADQSFAVIDQQPDVELDAGELEAVDAIGLPASPADSLKQRVSSPPAGTISITSEVTEEPK